MIRSTHTFAILDIGKPAYDAVRKALENAGPEYLENAIRDYHDDGELIHIPQIALRAADESEHPDKSDDCLDGEGPNHYPSAAHEIADLVVFSSWTFEYVNEHRQGDHAAAIAKLQGFMLPKFKRIIRSHARAETNAPPTNSDQVRDYIGALDWQQDFREEPALSELDMVKDVASVFLRKRDIIRMLLWKLGMTNTLYTQRP